MKLAQIPVLLVLLSLLLSHHSTAQNEGKFFFLSHSFFFFDCCMWISKGSTKESKQSCLGLGSGLGHSS